MLELDWGPNSDGSGVGFEPKGVPVDKSKTRNKVYLTRLQCLTPASIGKVLADIHLDAP